MSIQIRREGRGQKKSEREKGELKCAVMIRDKGREKKVTQRVTVVKKGRGVEWGDLQLFLPAQSDS